MGVHVRYSQIRFRVIVIRNVQCVVEIGYMQFYEGIYECTYLLYYIAFIHVHIRKMFTSNLC